MTGWYLPRADRKEYADAARRETALQRFRDYPYLWS